MAMQQILTRFEKDDLAALDSVAAHKKLSRAQALREAVCLYVDANADSTASHDAFGILKSSVPEVAPGAPEEKQDGAVMTEDGEPYDAAEYASEANSGNDVPYGEVSP